MVRSPSPPHSGVEVCSRAGHRRFGRPRVGGGSYASNVAKTGTAAANWGGNVPADVIERRLRSRPWSAWLAHVVNWPEMSCFGDSPEEPVAEQRAIFTEQKVLDLR